MKSFIGPGMQYLSYAASSGSWLSDPSESPSTRTSTLQSRIDPSGSCSFLSSVIVFSPVGKELIFCSVTNSFFSVSNTDTVTSFNASRKLLRNVTVMGSSALSSVPIFCAVAFSSEIGLATGTKSISAIQPAAVFSSPARKKRVSAPSGASETKERPTPSLFRSCAT